MFSWFKKSLPSQSPPNALPLYFQDTHSAFEYACEFLHNELVAGAILPSLVLDVRAAKGSDVAVRLQPDGTQVVRLRVCSKDGGYMVMASTVGANGPSLQPGDLVAWQAGLAVEAMASQFPDTRSMWTGLILAKLLPEYTTGRGWAIEQTYKQ